MADLEIKIENWFVAGMRRRGYMTYKGDASAEKQPGWSDRFFFGFKKDTVFVEFKRLKAPKKRKGEKLQDYIRGQLKKRGFPCYKVRGWVQARRVFANITGEVYVKPVRSKRLAA